MKMDPATDSGRSSSDGITNQSQPGIMGYTEPFSKLEFVAYGNQQQIVLGSTQAKDDGSWYFKSANALTDGNYTIVASATDVAGNLGSDKLALQIQSGPLKVSAADLTALFDLGDSNTDNLTSAEVLQFDGYTNPGNFVTLSNGKQSWEVQADANGRWYSKTAELPEGTHIITTMVEDMAGNKAQADQLTQVTIDRTAPSVSIYGSSDTQTRTVNLYGTAELGRKVDLHMDGKAFANVTADFKGNWNYATSKLPDSQYKVSASQSDAAGNFGVSNTIVVSVGVQAVSLDAIAEHALVLNPQELPEPCYMDENTITVLELNGVYQPIWYCI